MRNKKVLRYGDQVSYSLAQRASGPANSRRRRMSIAVLIAHKKQQQRRERARERLRLYREREHNRIAGWVSRFDANGSGSLEREELSALLHHLTGTEPDDDMLDRLLKLATEVRTFSMHLEGNPNGSVQHSKVMRVVSTYRAMLRGESPLDRVGFVRFGEGGDYAPSRTVSRASSFRSVATSEAGSSAAVSVDGGDGDGAAQKAVLGAVDVLRRSELRAVMQDLRGPAARVSRLDESYVLEESGCTDARVLPLADLLPALLSWHELAPDVEAVPEDEAEGDDDEGEKLHRTDGAAGGADAGRGGGAGAAGAAVAAERATRAASAQGREQRRRPRQGQQPVAMYSVAGGKPSRAAATRQHQQQMRRHHQLQLQQVQPQRSSACVLL